MANRDRRTIGIPAIPSEFNIHAGGTLDFNVPTGDMFSFEINSEQPLYINAPQIYMNGELVSERS